MSAALEAAAERLLPNGRIAHVLSTGTAVVVRSGRPDALTGQDWSELHGLGITNVVDLRNGDERTVPEDRGLITTHHRPVEDQSDADFMREFGTLLNTPQYYAAVMERWPDMILRAIDTLVDAASVGPVLVHCSAGRDRTGMIVALTAELAGVPREQTLDDYESAVRGANEVLREHPRPHEGALDGHDLEAWVRSVRAHLEVFLEACDVREWIARHGQRSLTVKAEKVFSNSADTRAPS